MAREVTEAADAVAERYAAVTGDQWQRSGTRSNGDRFTVDTFARYHLHDLVHHAHDVSHITKRVTVASYDAHAEKYRDEHPADVRRRPRRDGALRRAAAGGARVLEIGSGSGRDARAMEEAGAVRPPHRHHPGLRRAAARRRLRGRPRRPAHRRPGRPRRGRAVRRGVGGRVAAAPASRGPPEVLAEPGRGHPARAACSTCR